MRIGVFHLRRERPQAPGYQALLDHLDSGLRAAIDELGWEADVVYSAEHPVEASLDAVERADVLLLMGGEDVEPSRYGGAAEYPGSGHHVPAADEAHIAVVREAIRIRKPLLGICRGLQVMNVALGGTLIQDMAGHRLPDAPDPYVRTRLTIANALAGDVDPAAPGRCTHHQAVGELAPGLEVVARAPDGVVEAVVHAAAPVTGVQWHPEHPDTAREQLVPLLRRLEAQLRAQDAPAASEPAPA
ncbi:gamma-glutamyl-gamma-aminobutyrate hydrolase family protein [Microbacterium sp. MEC084]|uniref:gamma-glutamyl-gamma-aminobutyrate hydrolase family protein n=1 Tax=unclassified Microbacterium TaxID=2609290 RepID=UPI00070099C1|nr:MULTISPECIES: gamma-glutamyl-gamma-aminobutyrate hydrolase family protein [unclassified Microbacterium]KQY96759.1 hypothetical protein ASD19_09385 [Microbacterium sp. Root53]MCD1269053.1 gamma-glutamyl-gamma-aminobutyrate hydrolase family protein [Microbacterium sp. MEC084]